MGDMGNDKRKGEGTNDHLVGGPGADVLLGGTPTEPDRFMGMGDSDIADYRDPTPTCASTCARFRAGGIAA